MHMPRARTELVCAAQSIPIQLRATMGPAGQPHLRLVTIQRGRERPAWLRTDESAIVRSHDQPEAQWTLLQQKAWALQRHGVQRRSHPVRRCLFDPVVGRRLRHAQHRVSAAFTRWFPLMLWARANRGKEGYKHMILCLQQRRELGSHTARLRPAQDLRQEQLWDHAGARRRRLRDRCRADQESSGRGASVR